MARPQSSTANSPVVAQPKDSSPTPRESHRPFVRSPLATSSELENEPPPFPSVSATFPCETAFPDWRERLARNLSRRSDGRWEPLTFVHEDGK
jgi:hypothetical protein